MSSVSPAVSLAVSPFLVRKAAVLGAGVMGAQIAAHLVNANVEVILFELPAKEGDPNGNVLKAVDNLRKLEPSPLATPGARGLYPPGQLRAAPRSPARMRYRDRGDFRAHGLEIRALQKSRAASGAAYHLRQQYLGPVDQYLGRGISRGIAQSFLRRAFFQSAALYASGGVDRVPGDRCGDTR